MENSNLLFFILNMISLAFAVTIVVLSRWLRTLRSAIAADNPVGDEASSESPVSTDNDPQKSAEVQSILKGLEDGEFKMYLQFVVDNETKKIVSAEALSRWNKQGGGIVAPGGYIRLMEEASLISKHDFYMFELVCRQLEKWNGTKYGNIAISCNFTRITLSEIDFADKLHAISSRYNFEPSNLAIEITEDAIEKDRENLSRNLEMCKKLGFLVYLDDLGGGYTSLSNLAEYPVDIVKIDRDILLKTNTHRGKELFCGIIALAHILNLKVICEGVETEEQNSLVSQSDCDFIQGWYYSTVIPPAEWESFIDKM